MWWFLPYALDFCNCNFLENVVSLCMDYYLFGPCSKLSVLTGFND